MFLNEFSQKLQGKQCLYVRPTLHWCRSGDLAPESQEALSPLLTLLKTKTRSTPSSPTWLTGAASELRPQAHLTDAAG